MYKKKQTPTNQTNKNHCNKTKKKKKKKKKKRKTINHQTYGELKKLRKMKVIDIQIVIGIRFPKVLIKRLEELEIRGRIETN